jgi:5-(carboxyamino)imidazole ribonucleotide mutase
MSSKFVAIFVGSQSDLDVVKSCTDTLTKLGIAYELKISSAHRTPSQTLAYVQDADSRGCQVFIAAAGVAAHLAGTVAAHTHKPVIGIPIASGSLQGMDALLSTVQMPGGIPVATVAIGKAGAKNAAYLAGQILALTDAQLAQKISDDRAEQAQKIAQANKELLAQ